MKVKVIWYIFGIDLDKMSRRILSLDRDIPVLPSEILEFKDDVSPYSAITKLLETYIKPHPNFLTIVTSFNFDTIEQELILYYTTLIGLDDTTGNSYWIDESLWKFGKNIQEQAGKI